MCEISPEDKQLDINNLLYKIRNDLHARTIANPSPIELLHLTKRFQERVLPPVLEYLKNPLIATYNLDETTLADLASFEGDVATSKLTGFGKVDSFTHDSEIYNLEAQFSLGKGNSIRITAKIERSDIGLGAAIKTYDVFLNNKSIKDIFVNSDDEGVMEQFIIEDYLCEYEYDASRQSLSENDVFELARILNIK